MERQAAALGEMLDTLSRQQERMERQPAAAAEQDEMAARLADAQRQLEQMASRADGPRRDAVQHAADEAGQASSTFESHEGRPENLERPMAALAEAQQETLGEARHVAAVLEEINRLHGEVRRLSEIVEKDPTKIESEVVEEWVDAFRRREGAIEKKVSAALGAPTDGLSRRLRRVSGAGDGHAGDEALTPFALDEIAEAIGSAQAALRERLRLLAQRDQLLTMQGQSVPRDYREQVTAYFLKLSREEADAAAAAAEAAAP